MTKPKYQTKIKVQITKISNFGIQLARQGSAGGAFGFQLSFGF